MKDFIQQTPENITWHVWDEIPRIAFASSGIFKFLYTSEGVLTTSKVTVDITLGTSQSSQSKCI